MAVHASTIGPRGDAVATRVPLVDHRHSTSGPRVFVSTARGRRRRCWLILANLMGWALIVLAARAFFS
jgi:hypothetical protein